MESKKSSKIKLNSVTQSSGNKYYEVDISIRYLRTAVRYKRTTKDKTQAAASIRPIETARRKKDNIKGEENRRCADVTIFLSYFCCFAAAEKTTAAAAAKDTAAIAAILLCGTYCSAAAAATKTAAANNLNKLKINVFLSSNLAEEIKNLLRYFLLPWFKEKAAQLKNINKNSTVYFVCKAS